MGLSLSYGGIYVISPWIMTTFATWIRRYFCFYLWESGDRIVFSTYFISDVEKGTER